MFKLTTPVTIIDVNGNSNETERTFVFSNKEELIEFISGDTDGDNYGSSLLKFRQYDNKLYEEVGRICNHITYLFETAAANNVVIDAIKTKHGWETETNSVCKPIRRK